MNLSSFEAKKQLENKFKFLSEKVKAIEKLYSWKGKFFLKKCYK